MIYKRFLWGLWTQGTCEVSEACLCPAGPLHSPGLDSQPGDRQLIPMSRAFVRTQERTDTGRVSRQACGFPGLCGRKVMSLRTLVLDDFTSAGPSAVHTVVCHRTESSAPCQQDGLPLYVTVQLSLEVP